jgi:hypothetical protein
MQRQNKPMGHFNGFPWRAIGRGLRRGADLAFALGLVAFGGGLTFVATMMLRTPDAVLARIGSTGHPDQPFWTSAVEARHWLIGTLAMGLILAMAGVFELRAWLLPSRRNNRGSYGNV